MGGLRRLELHIVAPGSYGAKAGLAFGASDQVAGGRHVEAPALEE